MASHDKKLELLRNRIQSDLKVEPENLDDLVKYSSFPLFLFNLDPCSFVVELLKKGIKDRLLSELKEIYEVTAFFQTNRLISKGFC